MDSGLKQSKNQLDQISPSFCLAKWNQATLHLFNGHTQSCHHVNSHAVSIKQIRQNPAALHNTLRKDRQRKKMMLGIRPRECSYCWKMEDQGQFSDRVFKSREPWAQVDLADIQKDPFQPHKVPRYLEVAFDNICNFKCLYCSPSYSSSWRAEIEKHGPYPTSRRYNNLWAPRLKRQLPRSEEEQTVLKQTFWKWWPDLQDKVQHLRVTGGEPLLSRDTWLLLEKLQTHDHSKMNFALNSNLGVPTHLIEKLCRQASAAIPRLNSFTLYCSIDCVGPGAEYIRHGLNEKIFWQHVRYCLKHIHPPFTLSFMITVNALSLVGLKGLMQKIVELRKEFPQHHIAFDTPYLRNPEHLSVQILPASFSVHLKDAIEVLRASSLVGEDEVVKLERLLKLLQNNPWRRWKILWMRRDFYFMIKECDKRRNLNFLKSFPEMTDFWKTCQGIGEKWPRFLF